MPLIKSISGIRGTIGGVSVKNLTPLDIVSFASSYGTWLKNINNKKKIKVIVGKDARISGDILYHLVSQTLTALGIDIINLGLTTTPTLEMAVILEKADGGIVLTASHNPKEWNALKLLDKNGEFISKKDGEKILKLSQSNDFSFATIDNLGKITDMKNYINKHINKILELKVLKIDIIKQRKFKIVVDGINSTGGTAVPMLLKKLNAEVIKINCNPTGDFAHNPEPIEENLLDVLQLVTLHNADMGIVVDPDVDRLVFIDEKGKMFGEEYTLVACADYILSKEKGNTVSNLSSTRALEDITKQKYGQSYYSSSVGEVNVVESMKKNNAVIGGEGNGGVIYPALHYGRDALLGIVIFLSLLAEKKITVSKLKNTYPKYYMKKDKMKFDPDIDIDNLLDKIALKYKNERINKEDGLKIDFEKKWVHIRKSNTESIIRIYAEALTSKDAENLTKEFISEFKNLL